MCSDLVSLRRSTTKARGAGGREGCWPLEVRQLACLWPLTQWDLRRCVYGWFEAMRLDRPRPRHGGMQAPGPGGLGGLRQVEIESQLGGGTGRGQRVVGEGGLGDTGDGRELHRPSCGDSI